MCLNRATRHNASSSLAPQRNKVRRWLDGWRKVRRGTLILRFLAARKAEPWTGRSGWLPWHAAPGGILLLTERLQHWQLGLASDKLPFRPRTQTSGTSQKETIMHSPGVPFRRSVLHCRREQAIAHQDSDRSDMLFSPLLCRLNGLTLFHRRARCWQQMRQCQTQIVHFSPQAEPTHGAGSVNQCRAKKLVGSLSTHEASLSA